MHAVASQTRVREAKTNRITVKSVKTEYNKVIIDFACQGQVRKFFSNERFFAEYSVPVTNIPGSILLIPFLATACPIAWAVHADVHVEMLDENFFYALKRIKLALQKFYPRMNFSGEVCTDTLETSQVGLRNRSMCLFSGGIDSLATYVCHEAETPILVSIHGVDAKIDVNKGWRIAEANLRDFSKRAGVELSVIRSNFYAILDHLMLTTYNERLNGSWWGQVMHGLAFLGLCAPLAYVEGVGKLYIASSHTPEFRKPWASAPEIDSNLRWAGTKCIHDAYELSRQEKIQVISDYVQQGHDWLIIRVCYKSHDGSNCSICEKCSRTIIGLILAGIDPSKHGFNISANMFRSIKKKLINDEWSFTDNDRFMWTDLQHHACFPRNVSDIEAREFMNWLSSTKIRSIGKETWVTPPQQKVFLYFLNCMPYFICKITERALGSFKSLGEN